ncbi:MAG: MaoC/PaaZ C-terminal domain-containing protein, partial [Bacteroidota bacterium]
MEAYVGKELGLTEWMPITQERINTFAEATDDHQWIHVDPNRAQSESPFKNTVAHGFLILSLATKFCYDTYTIGDV